MLQHNYTFIIDDNDDARYIDGITIAKQITIIGNGYTISGNNVAKIFTIDHSNVILDNITFVNSKGAVSVKEGADNCVINNSYFDNNTRHGTPGGAVCWEGNHGNVINTNFNKNSVTGDDARANRGGALYWTGDFGSVTNCNFTYNKNMYGSAICFGNDDTNPSHCTVSECNFINNTAGDWAGAILVSGENLNITHCNFTNNSAQHAGAIKFESGSFNSTLSHCNFDYNKVDGEFWRASGAVEIISSNVTVDYCNFTNNSASHYAGALKIESEGNVLNGANVTVSHCNFINNTAGYSFGAVEWQGINGIMEYCNFVNNNASYEAGAVIWTGINGTIRYSNFTNNRVDEYNDCIGGGVSWQASNGTIIHSKFIDNYAGGDGGAVFWNGELGEVYYSNFTDNLAEVGGAINWNTDYGNVSYCYFTGNNATDNGGAINWNATEGTVSNSNFTGNNADKGGAIMWIKDNGNVSYCNFTDNTASGDGGAVYWDGANGNVSYSNFTGNNVSYSGGAILWKGDNGNVSYSNFNDNHADVEGGAIFWHEDCVNGDVSYSNFTDNHANNGGAILWKAEEGNVYYSNFNDNHANNGGAIYWHEDGVNGNVSYSNFTDNHANNGGAVYWDGSGGTVSYSNFTDNDAAGDGGAIEWNGGGGTVSYSDFTGNNATENGGAVYWDGEEGILSDSSFTNNTASEGGAVYWSGNAEDGSITNSAFFNNTADNSGGAISWVSDDPYVSDCNFTLNSAKNAEGGAIRFHPDVRAEIINCNFNSNSAKNAEGGAVFTYTDFEATNSNFTNNTAVHGGAIYSYGFNSVMDGCQFINNTAYRWGGAVCWTGENGQIKNGCQFINNTADEKGGALYIEGDGQDIEDIDFTGNTADLGGAIFAEGSNIAIDEAYFNNNNATSGSAIYKTKESDDFNISNTVFEKNQAESEAIIIDVTNNETFAPRNVDVIIKLKARDNIANAIWNDGTTETIKLENIKCQFSYGTSRGRSQQTFNRNGLRNPDDEFISDDFLWQSPYEDAQLINVIIRNQAGGVMYNITDGVIIEGESDLLSAWSEDLIVTKTDGNDIGGIKTDGAIAIAFDSLPAGVYTVSAEHKEDAYYTQIPGAATFVLYEGLTVTKTTEDVLVTVGDNVTYNITITNPSVDEAVGVNITDYFPQGFELLSYKTTWLSPGHLDTEVWEHKGNGVFYINNGDSDASSCIPPRESVVLTLTFKANNVGTFNNAIKVESQSTLPISATSQDTTVLPIITKHVVGDIEYDVGDDVKYSIFIDVTGANLRELVVYDDLDDSFVLDKSSISENWEYDEVDHAFKYKLGDIPDTLTLNFTVKVTKSGKYTNFASIQIGDLPKVTAESEEITVYNPDVDITKTVVEPRTVTVGEQVAFIINVTNTGDRPLAVGEVTVWEDFDGLSGNYIEEIKGQWRAVDAALPYYALESTLDVDDYACFKIYFTTKSVGKFYNYASVEKFDKQDSDYVEVLPNITKHVDKSDINVGESVEYSIFINATGSSELVIKDILNESFVLDKSSISENWEYDEGDHAFKYKLSDIQGPLTLKFKVNITKAGNYTNVASLKLTDLPEVTAESEVTRVREVILNVTKDVNGATVVANNTLVNYTINVSNIGDANATLVNIVDVLPGNLNYTGKWGVIEANGASVANSTLSWEVSNITAGSYVSIWFAAIVNTDAAGVITNVVNVDCSENRTKVSDDADVTVVPVVLNVTKTANATAVAKGVLINYTIVVDNIGPGNATTVNVTDIIPDGLIYNRWGVIDAKGATVTNKTLSDGVEWIISNITAGSSITLWVEVKSESYGNLTNYVTVNSKENKTLVGDDWTVEVGPVVLNVDKVVNGATVVANNTLVNYTITVSNVGRINATLVNIADILPGNLTYAGKWGIIEANGADISNTALSWTVSNISAGSHVSIWLAATVNTDEAGNITNVVRVNCKENGTVVSSKADVTVVPIVLNVTKVVNGATVVANNTLVNYTIVVDNIGEGNATLVNVVDLLPVGLVCSNADVIDADGASVLITISPGRVEWIISNIAAGKSVSLWIAVRTTSVGNFTNNVTVNSKENKTLVKDNATVDVLPVALNVTKTANVTVVANNTLVNYTITVSSIAEVNATLVNIVDALPGNLTYAGKWGIIEANGAAIDEISPLTWEVSNIAAGSHVSIWFTVTVNTSETGNITNVVRVKCNENDTVVSAEANITVVPVVLNVTKTANVTVVANNTLVNYTIVVDNIGDANATLVNVVDLLPVGLVCSNADVIDADGASVLITISPNGVEWIISNITAGKSVSLWIEVRTVDTGNLTNNVTVNSKENKTLVKDNETVEVLPVVLNVTKTANVTLVSVGDSVEFTLNVTNTGLIEATDINVTDLLDAAFEVQSIGNGTYLKYNDTERIVWNIPSLGVGDSTFFTVVVKVTRAGTFNNTAVVKTPKTDETISTVNVTAKIPTHTTVSNVTTYPDTTVNITVNVTADDGKVINGNVTVYFPDGSNKTVEIINGTGNTTWHVPANYAPGNYTDRAVYGGNETYFGSEGIGNIEVLPIPTHTTVSNVTTYPDTDVDIFVNVTADDGKPVNGNVTVVLPDGSDRIVLIVNGTGNTTWHVPANYTPGNYSVPAKFEGNETYLPSEGVGNIEVLPVPTNVTVSNVTTYPDTDVDIFVNVTAEDGKPVNGNVTVVLPDGSDRIVLIVNGTGNTTWHVPANYTPGNYSVPAKFEGNETYLPSEGVGNIEVLPIPTHTIVGNVTTYPDTNITIPINVTADDNKTISGNVTITFPDGSNQTVEIINGTGNATWHVPANYTPGNYTDFAVFDGNETYLPSNGTGNIEVLPIPTHTTVENVTGKAGQNVTVPVNVTADDGKPVNGNVTITFPDGTNQTVEIVNGTGNATWAIPDDYGGVYNDTASYPGNATYLPSNGTGIITVIPKIPTHTVVGNVTTYPDTDVTVPVNVTADDGIPFNGNVTITFPDGSNQTVEIVNGTGNATWHVPANYTPGDYPDFAVYDGNETYLPSNGTGTITVIPIPTHTTVGNVTAYPGRNVTIPVNVTADDGKPFNGNVTITFPDGTNQTVEIINGTGNATWTVPANYVPGDYPDKDSYAGNETYLPSNGSGIITVLPIPTTVSIGNITTYPGENVTIPINATIFDGEPFTGNATVQMPDGSTQTVEIINGTGNITWFVPEDYVPDNYTDTIKFLGNETYLPSNGTGNIEVIKIPTNVTIGNVTAYPGEEVKIPINVTADNGKPFNGNVTVKLPDGTNQTVEIINGTGNITWTVPDDYSPDVYNDTIEVIGDERYLPSNGTGHVEVVRIPTHITVGNVTTFAGRDVTIPINVTADDGKPFTGNVTITLPDGSTKTVEIVNGTGTTTWFVPGNYTPDTYPDTVRFDGDVKYLPSEGKGTITVIKIPVDIVVGNVTAHPGDKVTIPIEVIPRDGSIFNGNVTVELPDGSKKVVEITNGKGSVDWTIPMDYKGGDYLVKVSSDETEAYYPANGTGVITVIVDEHPQNGTVTPQKDMPKDTLARYETGNPILALLAVLAVLGISVKRKK